jgi:hypothetical protein
VIALVALVAFSSILLWVAPAIGVVATAITMAIVPPWGRGLIERAVISAIVGLGIIALVFPRAGTTPIDHTTARGLLIGVMLLALALRAIPSLRRVRVPRFTWPDAFVLVTITLAAWWPISAYLGADAAQTVSGLLFSGWDNHAHYTTFANTYVSQSTTWPTADGSEAWNQWYPALHTTAWALLQYAASSSDLGRIDLLQPYVVWSAATFALCLGALTWMAASVAGRFSRGRQAPILAAAGFAVFALLGSVQNLFQAGFTNFILALTITATASYIASRSWRSARTLGWFLVPLAAISVIGLWTPLVLGLVPAGFVVAVALWRHRRSLGVAYVMVGAAAGILVAITQGQAVLNASDVGLVEFGEVVGGIDIGMAPFNLSAGVAAPLLAVLIGLLVWRMDRPSPIPFAVASPAVAAALVALFFARGSMVAGVDWTVSYYVLKSLNAAYLMAAPIVIAVLASGTALLVRELRARTGTGAASLAAAIVALLAITAFGYVGVLTVPLNEGYPVAPGIANATARAEFLTRPTGEPIVAGALATQGRESNTPILWEAGGTLPNLWGASLSGVLSKEQQSFYLNLPDFPYDDKTVEYLKFQLGERPDHSFDLLWFRDSSEALLAPLANISDRITVTRVPMPASDICPECMG